MLGSCRNVSTLFMLLVLICGSTPTPIALSVALLQIQNLFDNDIVTKSYLGFQIWKIIFLTNFFNEVSKMFYLFN